MPNLGNVHLRLLLFGAAVATGPLCAVLGTSAVVTATATAIGGIAGGLIGDDIRDHIQIAHRLREKNKILTNHDLTKAVGNAIATVLLAVGEEYKKNSEDGWHQELEKLAKAVPSYWQEIVSQERNNDSLTQLREENLPSEIFATKASDFATVKALDKDSWREFLSGLSAANGVNLIHTVEEKAAERLHTIFPKALKEVLKDDFEHGGKAFASMTLSLLGEISAGIKENQAKLEQLLTNQNVPQPTQVYHQIITKLDGLISQNQITPELEKCLQEIAPQIESGFQAFLAEVNVSFEQIKKEIELLRIAIDNISTRKEDENRHQELLRAINSRPKQGRLDHASPSVEHYQGRAGELQKIGEYLAGNRISLIKIIGVGGIGKSTLAGKVFKDEEKSENKQFQNTFWQDLTISADFIEFAGKALRHLGDYSLKDLEEILGNKLNEERALMLLGESLPLKRNPTQELIERLVNLLQDHQFLVVIDNLETVLDEQWEGSLWCKFFCRWLNCASQSKLIVTSREAPILTELKCKTILLEKGLNANEGAQLLRELGVLGEAEELEKFVESVGGYPLSLTLIAGLLVTEESDNPQINYLSRYGNLYQIQGIHRGANHVSVDEVLTESFARLEDKHKQLLSRLIVYRLPFGAGAAQVMYEATLEEAEKDLKVLAKRCFLLKAENGEEYKLQPVILNYLESKAEDLTQVHHQAIEYYQSIQKPDNWETKDDVSGYIEICHHWCVLKQHIKAYDTIRLFEEFLNKQGLYNVLGEVYEEIVKDWQRQNDDEEKKFGDSLNNLGGYAYYNKGDYDTALDYFQQSLEIRQKIGNQEDIADSLNNLGFTYYFKGDYDTALDYLQQSLEIRQKIGNQEDIADSLNNLGFTYDNKGDYDTALYYYQQLLDIRQKIGNQHSIADSLYNLGITYYDKGDYDTALDYHQQSLEIRQKIGNQKDIAESFNNLGNTYYFKEDYDIAIDYFQQSLEIRQKIGNQKDIADSLDNLGYAYSFKEDYDTAIDYFQESLEIRQKIGNQKDIANSLENLGYAYRNIGDYYIALDYFQQSLDIR